MHSISQYHQPYRSCMESCITNDEAKSSSNGQITVAKTTARVAVLIIVSVQFVLLAGVAIVAVLYSTDVQTLIIALVHTEPPPSLLVLDIVVSRYRESLNWVPTVLANTPAGRRRIHILDKTGAPLDIPDVDDADVRNCCNSTNNNSTSPVRDILVETTVDDSLRECGPFLRHIIRSYYDDTKLAPITLLLHGHGPYFMPHIITTLNDIINGTSSSRYVRELNQHGFSNSPSHYATRCAWNRKLPQILPTNMIQHLNNGGFFAAVTEMWATKYNASVYARFMSQQFRKVGYACVSIFCCSEFLVTRKQVRSVPLQLYVDTLELMTRLDGLAACEDLSHLFAVLFGRPPHTHGIDLPQIRNLDAAMLQNVIGAQSCPHVMAVKNNGTFDDPQNSVSTGGRLHLVPCHLEEAEGLRSIEWAENFGKLVFD